MQDLITQLTTEEHDGSSLVDWLSALLTDLETTGWSETTEDPEASRYALLRSREVVTVLREAARREPTCEDLEARREWLHPLHGPTLEPGEAKEPEPPDTATASPDDPDFDENQAQRYAGEREEVCHSPRDIIAFARQDLTALPVTTLRKALAPFGIRYTREMKKKDLIETVRRMAELERMR